MGKQIYRFKIGAKVRCIEGQVPATRKETYNEGRGMGWKKGDIFTIDRRNLHELDRIYWVKEVNNGVYEEQLELYDSNIDTKFNRLKAKVAKELQL